MHTQTTWEGAAATPTDRTVSRSPSLRIVVAEDDADMRCLVARALRGEGHHVVELHDGNALLEYLASVLLQCPLSSSVDLVITDLRMPGANGLDVLAGIRSSGWDVPVIVVTAFGDASVHARGESLGALAVIDKPFDVAALARLVSGLAQHGDVR